MKAEVSFEHAIPTQFIPVSVTITVFKKDTIRTLIKRAISKLKDDGRFIFSEIDGYRKVPKSIRIKDLK